LAEVALVDDKTAAMVGGMSVTWWRDEVRAGRAPSPVLRQPRCTRWRLVDVRAFWAARGSAPIDDGVVGELSARAKKASDAAQAKRQAQRKWWGA
jgi:hypothetical protein